MDDPDNIDELLDRLPSGLAKKVARHLNQEDTGEACEDEQSEPFILPGLVPPPPPPPPPRERYDYSHLIRKPVKKKWWQQQF